MSENTRSTITGALIILAGGLLLLGNLGLLDVDIGTFVQLALAGGAGWAASRVYAQADSRDIIFYTVRLALAGFLGLISLSVLLDVFGLDLSLGWMGALFWPSLFILGGLFLMVRSTRYPSSEIALAHQSSVLIGKASYGRTKEALGPGRINVGIGDAAIDLTHGLLPAGETVIDVAMGIGDIEVLVPRELPVAVDVHAGIIDLKFLGKKQDIFLGHRLVASEGYELADQRVRLVVHAGIGDLEVTRLG